jgi:endonuclease-3
MTKNRSNKIIKNLKKFYGNPDTELFFVNTYELAISVILSAQTTDKQVNSVTPALFRKYPDFKSLSGADSSEVESIIYSTGFYKNKAKNIINLAKEVTDKYQGKLPDTLEELIELPGIGRKSANVILSVGFNKPALAVDTHILRISNRVGYSNTDDPYKAEMLLTSFIPVGEWKKAHLILIKHGRTICKARHPLCSECPITSLCGFEHKNL